jgi:hypothetical protein
VTLTAITAVPQIDLAPASRNTTKTTKTTTQTAQVADTLATPQVRKQASRARTMPHQHPARIIGTLNEEGSIAFLDVEITGGWSAPDAPTLTHWVADLRVHQDGEPNIEVASMSITIVDPMAGDPVAELTATDLDAGELGEVLFEGPERSSAFHAIAFDDASPVLLINTFEVAQDWTGTALTPLMALRVLKTFAGLGIRTAALHAAPIAEDMSPRERTRIGMKIEQMWSQVGFRNLDSETGFMAMSFDRFALNDTIMELAAPRPCLRAAADIW